MLSSPVEEMHRWMEHSQTVINHEEPLNLSEVEPNDELNIKTGRITRIKIKKAVKKLKTERLQDVIIYRQRQLRQKGSSQSKLDLCNRI